MTETNLMRQIEPIQFSQYKWGSLSLSSAGLT